MSLKSIVNELLKAVNDGSDTLCPPPRRKGLENADDEDCNSPVSQNGCPGSCVSTNAEPSQSTSDVNWPSTEFQEFPPLEESDKPLNPGPEHSEHVLEQAPVGDSQDSWPDLEMDNLLSHTQEDKEKLGTLNGK